jgi:glucokinase
LHPALTETRNTGEKALVFDIGGTFMRAASVDVKSGALISTESTPTPNYVSDGGRDAAELLQAVIEAMRELGARVLDGALPSRVVVGYPGPITESGTALRVPTILGPALNCSHDIQSRVELTWPNASVLVENDLTCAGFSFVARGYKDFCVITVGSGIGNKVFIDGRPLIGPRRRGGEIGHLRIPMGPVTPLQINMEELGSIASGRGSVNLARAWLSAPTPAQPRLASTSNPFGLSSALDSEQLVKAFRAGDELAEELIDAACHPLAVAIGCIHLAIGIETFFIVGGFAKALGERYRSLLVRRVTDTTWNVGQDWNEMIVLGSETIEEGLLGAAYLVSRDRHYAVHSKSFSKGFTT